MSSAPSSDFGAYVHPGDARLTAWRHVYENYLVVEDIYPSLARRFRDDGCTRFVEQGGGRGPISRLLAPESVTTMVADLDWEMLADAATPAVRADLAYLPLADVSVDGVAAVNCLYFLADPAIGIREAHRVLEPGGLYVASAPSRWNDPELEGIDPNWGRPSPFDSEDAPDLVASVFHDIDVQPWELTAYRLPDKKAIADYLHAFNILDWEAKADAIDPPLEITKRGAEVWARR